MSWPFFQQRRCSIDSSHDGAGARLGAAAAVARFSAAHGLGLYDGGDGGDGAGGHVCGAVVDLLRV
ncbi:uncharacterized protein EKO05_0011297 [Ascochyta rabiei]|uniref:uncharacterized protein n=1 Tax=Didymella rabiei TaxID=5454 RepID=UPI002203E1D1|nr:uncharacterized protein EKO05_0011297 [Ascochyta rabiei]UPX21093.1 hypothetical protein EKO05_0011297 [Ascochyta rabiei]